MKILTLTIAAFVLNLAPVLAQEPPPAKVVMATITQQEVAENQIFIGLLYYERISHVSSEVVGLVAEVLSAEGDHMKKGEPLLKIDTEMLDKDIVLAETKIEQAELRIRYSEKQYKRLESLLAKKGVSESNYDDAFFAYQNNQIEKQQAQKTLDKLHIKKRKSVITAPFDGVILSKDIDTGDWISQGKELFTIAATNDLYVQVPVSEKILQFITIGETVPVNITAFDRELIGQITDFDPVADPKTKNIFLKIKIPPQPKVAQNMSATVYVPTCEVKKLSIIPRDALIKFQGEDFVYTVQDGKAVILPAHIVTYRGDTVGVDNPHFTEGMQVVIEGNERLRPDQPVSISREK